MTALLREPVADRVATIVAERDRLAALLVDFPGVEKVYPSDANFLLVKTSDADALYEYLLSQGIIVRNRTRVPGCAGCLRLTVGLPEENRRLEEALAEWTNQ